MQIGLESVGVELVLSFERVDHQEVFARMRNAITRRISHLVFNAVFLNLFHFEGQSAFYLMVLGLVFQHQFEALNICLQIVAGVLEIGSYGQILASLGLRQPVLPLNVELFLLARVISRSQKADVGVSVKVMRQVERAEIGAEQVFFFTIEIHFECLYVLQGSERGLAVVRLEIVVVVRDVADEVDGPTFVGRETQIGLIVKEIRIVFAFLLKRTEQIACGLVAHARQPRKPPRSDSEIGTATQ